jgi:hypothetical protein
VKEGDVVYTSALDLGGYERRSRVRAVVVELMPPSAAGRHAQRVKLRFGNGRIETRWSTQVEPYNAVDSLADLVRCRQCADYGVDQCKEHSGVIFMDARSTVGSDAAWTTTFAACASNTDPITALGDLVREPERRRLTSEERVSRSKARRRSKASRRRNRR